MRFSYVLIICVQWRVVVNFVAIFKLWRRVVVDGRRKLLSPLVRGSRYQVEICQVPRRVVVDGR
jgi:hypothetical protein